MEYNNDFRYDLKLGQEGEKLVASIFTNPTIEVKTDSWIYKTGNVAIEYESRGKPSGIATTQAAYWTIVFSGGYNNQVIITIETERLKRIARKYLKKGKTKAVGDSNTSLVVLIPATKLIELKDI